MRYWYRTEVTICVVCGREDKIKFRVYTESDKGLYVIQNMCSGCIY